MEKSADMNDGGQAFPHPSVVYVDSCDPGMQETLVKAMHGMTLRDWFATNASEQDIYIAQSWEFRGGKKYRPKYSRVVARYIFADAMLAMGAEFDKAAVLNQLKSYYAKAA